MKGKSHEVFELSDGNRYSDTCGKTGRYCLRNKTNQTSEPQYTHQNQYAACKHGRHD